MKQIFMPVLALVFVLGFSSCQGEGGKLAREGCDLTCNILDAIEEDDHDAVVEAIEEFFEWREDNEDDIEDYDYDEGDQGDDDWKEYNKVKIDCDCMWELDDELEDYIDDASEKEQEEIFEAMGYK